MGNSESSLHFRDSFQAFFSHPHSTPVHFDEQAIKSMMESAKEPVNVFASIPPDSIRKLRNEKLDSLAFLLHYVIDTMHEHAHNNPSFTVEDNNVVNGCVNMLARIIPILMEDQNVLELVLWKNLDRTAHYQNESVVDNSIIEPIEKKESEVEKSKEKKDVAANVEASEADISVSEEHPVPVKAEVNKDENKEEVSKEDLAKAEKKNEALKEGKEKPEDEKEEDMLKKNTTATDFESKETMVREMEIEKTLEKKLEDVNPALIKELSKLPEDFEEQVIVKQLSQGVPSLPYAIKLMEAISVLLFKPNFTIKRLTEVQLSQIDLFGIDEKLIWKGGAGVEKTLNHTETSFDKNRCGLLRLLLGLFSQSLYLPAEDYLRVINPFLTYFTSKKCKNSKNTFFSLLNTVLTYDCEGLRIPYMSTYVSNTSYEDLTDLCIQLLCVITDYKPPSQSNLLLLLKRGPIAIKLIKEFFDGNYKKPIYVEEAKETDANREDEDESKKVENKEEENVTVTKPPDNTMEVMVSNEYYRLLRVVHGKVNLDAIFAGFNNLFSNILRARNSYLPNSVREISFVQELCILFWKILTTNPSFVEDLVSRREAVKIAVTILFLINKTKADPTKTNLLYVSIFTIFILSSYREFSLLLNQPYEDKLAFDLPVPVEGTYADLLMTVICNLVQTGPRLLKSMYKSLISIITNIAPYVKNLNAESCKGIIYLLGMFSSKQFMFVAEDNAKALALLVEAINYIISYQDESNSKLIYALLAKQETFESLKAMTLETAFSEEAHEGRTHTSESNLPTEEEKKSSSRKGSQSKEESIPNAQSDKVVVKEETKEEVKKEEAGPTGGHIPPSRPHFAAPSMKWIPTQEWFDEWKAELPGDNIIEGLKYLKQKMERLDINRDESKIIDFLSTFSLKGVLPNIPKIFVIRYSGNDSIDIWLITFVWGVIFMRNQEVPIFDSSAFRMFKVSFYQKQF